MKIIRNIPMAIKAYYNLKYLNQFKKEIDDANKTGDIEREKANILLATSTWGKNLCKSIGVNISIYGEENLPTPDDTPVVYMCNHQGYADIIVLCAVLDTIEFGFVAKDDLEKVPLYGQWIKRIRSVMMDRSNSRASLKAISQGIAYIKDGFSLAIFPEGTRSKGHEIGEFKAGAMKLATKPKVPIIPITIDGTYNVFESTGIIGPADVKVLIHPKIETKDMTKEDERKLDDQVYEIIKGGLTTLEKK